MDEWIRSIRLFAWGVAKRWWVIVVGLLLGIVGLVDFLSEGQVDIPEWIALLAGVLALLVASFVTFHEMRLQVVRMEADLRPVFDRREAIQSVAEQRDEGLTLRGNLIGLGSNEAGKPLYDTWFSETVTALERVAPQFVGEFKRGGWKAADIIGILDPELNDLILRLDWRLERLGSIIQSL
jgi:hypothetical protein